MDLGTFIRIETNNGWYAVLFKHYEEIDMAVRGHIDNGEDRLLELATVWSRDANLRASAIESFWVTTPESRQQEFEFQRAIRNEEKQNNPDYENYE